MRRVIFERPLTKVNPILLDSVIENVVVIYKIHKFYIIMFLHNFEKTATGLCRLFDTEKCYSFLSG